MRRYLRKPNALRAEYPTAKRRGKVGLSVSRAHMPVSHLHAMAQYGVSGNGQALPFQRQIQRAFGGHDISQVKSHSDGVAHKAANKLGVRAYTTGERIVFRAPPDLRGAAHEAAHVIQQRSALSQRGGHSRAGDRHEQHADQVADAVSRGKSAESLLNQYSVQAHGHKPQVQAEGGAIYEPPEGEVFTPYPKAVGEKAFSDDEKQWIEQVLGTPVFRLLFRSYDYIPKTVLHRVQKKGGANGVFSSEINAIALTDKIYANKEYHGTAGVGEGRFQETDEEAFKSTLTHELFHYLEENARDISKNRVLPMDLITAIVRPTQFGFSAYAFGWFEHPESKSMLHFQLPNMNWHLQKYPDLLAVMNDPSQWERSPMPQSGRSINPEEDLAESLSRIISSQRMADAFKAQYPLRYKLFDRYLRYLNQNR